MTSPFQVQLPWEKVRVLSETYLNPHCQWKVYLNKQYECSFHHSTHIQVVEESHIKGKFFSPFNRVGQPEFSKELLFDEVNEKSQLRTNLLYQQ